MKKNNILSILAGLILVILIGTLASIDADAYTGPLRVISNNALSFEDKLSTEKIDNTDRNTAYIWIIEHMNNLKTMYDLSDAALEKMDAIFYEANVYIANNDMTVGQLKEYITTTKSALSTCAAGATTVVSETSSFLFLINATPTKTAVHGLVGELEISLINLGKDNVTNVVVTPEISTDPAVWPFDIKNASYVRVIPTLKYADTLEEAYEQRQDVSWSFQVNDDVKTGTYPLKFHLQYYRNGKIETTDLTTYVNVQGKEERGTLIKFEKEEEEEKKEDEKTATPRIIVTGFSTDPGEVYAGDTFNLTVTVKNTSVVTPVSNIQFDLKAAPEGSDSTTTYEAFLPTSGSNTVYVPYIGCGETADITIEMTAKGDLVQKPYVVTISAKFEDSKLNAYETSTNVSVPVKQAARVDTGDVELTPEYAMVGDQVNVVFDVYNKGKTNLYNVEVKFADGSVSGGNTFLGKIAAGATGNVDADITCIAANGGILIATISYEDEVGNITTFEKEIELYISEPYYDEGMGDDMGGEFYPEDEMMEEGKSFPVVPVAIGGGIVAIIVIIIVITKISKKRKEARLKKALEEEDDI